MIKTGEPAPPFSLTDTTGNRVSLAGPGRTGRRSVLLPQGRHAGLHQGGVRLPRRVDGAAAARRGGPRRLARLGRFARDASPRSTGCPSGCSPTPTSTVMEAYDAWGEKTLYGKKTTGVIRSTVWIGPDGRVRRHWARVSDAEKHPDQVLAALEGGR